MACVRKRRGKWVVDWRDHLGVRRWLTFATKKAADDVLGDKIKESRHAVLVPSVDPDITVDAYADRWLQAIKATVEPRTLDSYTQLLRLHIRPALGPLKIRAVHRGHIKALLARKMAETTDDGRRRLGKNSVRLIRATLSVMLGDAVEDGLLTTNPALGIKRRGRKHPDTLSQAERLQTIRPLSPAQLATFLTTADALVAQGEMAARDAVVFLTLADTGTRPGEALALRWEDFDLAARTLHIARAVSSGQIKSTKTATTRYVDVTPRLADRLSRWQSAREADALAAGREPSPWMFPSAADTPLDELKVAKLFRTVLGRAHLPRFRLYDLRHTFATHLLALNAPPMYVSAQLGHTSPATTFRHYAHWIPLGSKEWIDRLAAARAEAHGSKTVADRGQTATRDEQMIYNPTESRCSSVAEQLIRNQQVVGSSPTAGSSLKPAAATTYDLR